MTADERELLAAYRLVRAIWIVKRLADGYSPRSVGHVTGLSDSQVRRIAKQAAARVRD